jgi:soluble lytic murein transglycosylase-like protein
MNIKTISILMSTMLFSFFSKPVAEKLIVSDYDQPAFREAFFDAARIYGRAGCGDVKLAEMTARSSAKTGLPPTVIAAVIAVESNCDPLAVSRDGGVGLLQVMPKIWAGEYNNFRDKNLLKAEDSMDVGTEILAKNVKEYGLKQGIRHYNGSGPDAELYAVKVAALAGVK